MANQQEGGRTPSPARTSPPHLHVDAEQSAERSVCVLCHAASTAPPQELVRSLRKHGASIQTCTDVFSMLAHACRVVGASATGPKRAVVLVLVQPERLDGVVELAAAVRRYAPRSALWYFDEHAKPQLRAVTGHELAAWSASPTANPTVGPTGPVNATGNHTRPGRPADAVEQAMRRAAGAAMGGFGGRPRLRLVDPTEGPADERGRAETPVTPDGRLRPVVMPSATPAYVAPASGSPASGSPASGSPAPVTAPNPAASVPANARARPSAERDSETSDELREHPELFAGGTRELLTAEELAMLLGDAPSFDSPLPPPPPPDSGHSSGPNKQP